MCVLTTAQAHEIRPAVATVTLAPVYQIELSLNVEALLAGVNPKHADTNESPNARRYDALRALPPVALEAQLRDFAAEWLKGVTVEFDGARVEPTLAAVQIPSQGDLALARISTLRLQGAMPNGVREFRFAYARDFGDVVLRVREGEVAPVSLWLKNGATSDPYVLGEGLRPRSTWQVISQYIVLGFTHILPYGLDHILFVMGLFLLSKRWQSLLVQVTAFTVAHSITLALTIYGVFTLPSSIVEPLIAASIAYVAVENIITTRLHAWRPFIVFGFGLLHGMGFAGVLEEIGMPRSEFLAALISFNVGVELGQMAVIALAFLFTASWIRHQEWYRARFAVPASLLIALVGVYWTIERVFFV